MASVVLAALLLVSAAALFAGGDACDNVPTMSWPEACNRSCSVQPRWLALCQETLLNAPRDAELTVFAIVAARQARLKYEDTMAVIDQMLGAGNMPAEEEACVSQCKTKYGEARGLMSSVADQMFACDLSRPRQEYLDAQVLVGACQNALWGYQGLPLFAMVSADLDLTMVAYELGALIVGK